MPMHVGIGVRVPFNLSLPSSLGYFHCHPTRTKYNTSGTMASSPLFLLSGVLTWKSHSDRRWSIVHTISGGKVGNNVGAEHKQRFLDLIMSVFHDHPNIVYVNRCLLTSPDSYTEKQFLRTLLTRSNKITYSALKQKMV